MKKGKFRFHKWKKEFLRNKYLILASLVLLAFSLVVYNFAGIYVDSVATNEITTDIIISNTAPIDLGFLYNWGYLIVILSLLLYPLVFRIKDFHIVVSQLSILVLVRDIFLCLTPVKTPIDTTFTLSSYIGLGFQHDLFFSGHTAIPFLGFLLFKESKIRWFFLAASIILGATVLLMHAHYSIDVASAFFITYGTFRMSAWLFKRLKRPDWI